MELSPSILLNKNKTVLNIVYFVLTEQLTI